MYQANINPLAHEHLTPEQWMEAVDLLEKNLGLEGHQRVVVEHVKEGRQHYHVIWNRVDAETMLVADMGGNYYTHERTARELEKQFELEHTPSAHGDERGAPSNELRFELWEHRAAERSGIDPKAVSDELTELWRTTDSGKAFQAAVEERGYILAKGDRRDFCIVDQAGDPHSLSRRLEGVTAKDVRERMSDIDRDSLPTVAEARQEQREARAQDDAPAVTVEEYLQDRLEKEPGGPKDRTFDTLAIKGALMVFDAASGVTEGLLGFVEGIMGAKSEAPKPNYDDVERILEQRRNAIAIHNLHEAVQRGENLSASDIRNLTPYHLDKIRDQGESHLRLMFEELERERSMSQSERDRERYDGRYRER